MASNLGYLLKPFYFTLPDIKIFRLPISTKFNIVEVPDIIRAPFGTSHELQCVATGDPPPLISWLKDGRTVIDAPCK